MFELCLNNLKFVYVNGKFIYFGYSDKSTIRLEFTSKRTAKKVFNENVFWDDSHCLFFNVIGVAELPGIIKLP